MTAVMIPPTTPPGLSDKIADAFTSLMMRETSAPFCWHRRTKSKRPMALHLAAQFGDHFCADLRAAEQRERRQSLNHSGRENGEYDGVSSWIAACYDLCTNTL